jgi:hypothetical protein
MIKQELDFIEYPTNTLAQAAYVTDATETVNQQNTQEDDYDALGNASGSEYRKGQSFQLQQQKLVTAVEVKEQSVVGSPTGNWTLRIETDSGGVPSGILANVNASIVVSPPGVGNTVKGTFTIPFFLNASTTFHLVIQCDNQSINNYWNIRNTQYDEGGYAYGTKQYSADGVWYTGAKLGDLYFKVYVQALQSYSEATIKTQGSYSLKAVAAITDSNGKTLTKILSPSINLSGYKTIKTFIKASRIGTNFQIGFHDAGGNTNYFDVVINEANTWHTIRILVSSIPNDDRDAIDQIIIKITNADADNIIYIDNIYAENIVMPEQVLEAE